MTSEVPGVPPKTLEDYINDIIKAIQQAWSNDIVVGTPTPVSGSGGDNTISIKSGGDIDFDPAGKYLASVGVQLESYATGDYIKEVAITNGTDRRTVVSNICLAYTSATIVFKSPVAVPDGYWVEVVITLSTTKSISVDSEFVW